MIAPSPSSSAPLPEPKRRKTWIDMINESVHTSDDIDIGDIDAVSREFIVVKRGYVNVHYYYIPLSKVEGWDGNVLWLKIIESDVKGNYERDKVPDPSQYYVKDYRIHTTDYYPELIAIRPELIAIPPKRIRPGFTSPSDPKVPRIYKCDLCDLLFNNEDELSKHVLSQH